MKILQCKGNGRILKKYITHNLSKKYTQSAQTLRLRAAAPHSYVWVGEHRASGGWRGPSGKDPGL